MNLRARFKEHLEGGASQLDLEIIDGDVDGAARHLNVDLGTEDWTLTQVHQQTAVQTTVPFVDRRVETPSVLRPEQVLGRRHIRHPRCDIDVRHVKYAVLNLKI